MEKPPNKIVHEIHEASTDDEIKACFHVIRELRPHIPSPTSLLHSTRIQQNEGFHLMYIKDNLNESSANSDSTELPVVVSIMSYRISHTYFNGRQLYINDLCTLSSAKKRGYAGQLLDYALELANREKCDVVTLDSGYARADAHRLYMNKRFCTTSHHFTHRLQHNFWKE